MVPSHNKGGSVCAVVNGKHRNIFLNVQGVVFFSLFVVKLLFKGIVLKYLDMTDSKVNKSTLLCSSREEPVAMSFTSSFYLRYRY